MLVIKNKETKDWQYHHTRCRINFQADRSWWALGSHMLSSCWIVLDLAKLQSWVSTSTFLSKIRFVPRARAKVRTRTARDFLKTIVAILELETRDAQGLHWQLVCLSPTIKLRGGRIHRTLQLRGWNEGWVLLRSNSILYNPILYNLQSYSILIQSY